MGFTNLNIQQPAGYSEDELRADIAKQLNLRNFSYRIDNKSLDARKKTNIHWEMNIAVSSPELKSGMEIPKDSIQIPQIKKKGKILVTGNGPAGFFAAFLLQKAGFTTIILERGKDVDKRAESISAFESGSEFDPSGNYAFGEGGAGTFSDGKLTSRSKRISAERQFITDCYISAGAPEEIAYMNHPHLGSDTLRHIVKNLREQYKAAGGTIHFETRLKDLVSEKNNVVAAITDKSEIEADYFILATGHSAFETFRMLIKRNVQFRPKNFAIGSRMEHPRQVINKAQWGKEEIPGLKAAEYRLTSNPDGKLPVYTFCMCPGGIIVPSAAYEKTNIVNGMSFFKRDLKFSNAGCVASVNPYSMLGENISAEAVLDWLESLESQFYSFSNGYSAPFCSIKDFINMKLPGTNPKSSYPLGLKAAPLWELLPEVVQNSMREGLKEFCRKIQGFDTGIIMGLESKTSAPVQVLRDENGLCTGFNNLYMAGEGSGYAGGIISSAADGVKIALKICQS